MTSKQVMSTGSAGTRARRSSFGTSSASRSRETAARTSVTLDCLLDEWPTGHRSSRPRARATAWCRELPQTGVEKTFVPRPEITFELLDGTQAAAHANELQSLHAEVYANPPDARNDAAARFADRFRVQRCQPCFVLAEARHGSYMVGYAAGMPLRPSTSWWRDLTTQLPGEVTAEHPGRTFALLELLVRASWRRQGIAARLHDLILKNRLRGTGHADRLACGHIGAEILPEMGLAQDRADGRSPSRLARVRPACHHCSGDP